MTKINDYKSKKSDDIWNVQKYDTEIKVIKDGIKNIIDCQIKIKLVHEIFFTIFALIVNVLKSDLSGGAVVTVISLLGKAYEPIAIFNVEYVDYKLNKVTVNKYIELLDIKDDKELSELKLNSFYDNVT